MNEWFASPLFWIAFLSLLPVAAGAVFAFGQWKGRVDSDRESFKALMAEVRSDIKEILGRLPSRTLTDSSPPPVDGFGQIHFRTLRSALSSSTRPWGIDASIRMMVASIGRI